MAKYKVIALSLGAGNNIYKSGDIVDSDNVGGEKNALDLVEKGFLKAIEQPKQKVEEKAKKGNSKKK